MHFARQRLAAVGPRLPARQDLFNKLLASKAIARAVEDEARSKKISHEKAQQNAIALMEEIAANFSYEMIRLSDRILGFTGTACIRASTCITLSVYVSWRTMAMRLSMSPATAATWTTCSFPTCSITGAGATAHRSRYQPELLARGPDFPPPGAFFIRRTFKGNKLYSTVFREYLGELFSRGYSVEYFVEGGRSRTGRLLDPKTGTLSMTIGPCCAEAPVRSRWCLSTSATST